MAGALATVLLRALFLVLNALPFHRAVAIIESLFRLVLFARPTLWKIGDTNLQIAFPEQDSTWRNNTLQKTVRSHAQLVVDSARLIKYDRAWVLDHVHFQNKEEFDRLQQEKGDTGVIIATGHLGSFELLAHSSALYGYPLAFVVRNFKSPTLDRWWIGIRERFGNQVISRSGALKRILRTLRNGTDVGLLFDQNVTRNRAVFVDFFGQPAATTRAVGVAALKTGAPLIVAAIRRTSDTTHEIIWERCPVEQLYEDNTLTQNEKVHRITQQASLLFEKMVRDNYTEWFWFHRRWKTQPSERTPSPYHP